MNGHEDPRRKQGEIRPRSSEHGRKGLAASIIIKDRRWGDEHKDRGPSAAKNISKKRPPNHQKKPGQRSPEKKEKKKKTPKSEKVMEHGHLM